MCVYESDRAVSESERKGEDGRGKAWQRGESEEA